MTHLISDILNKAAELIEPDGAWTQEQSVRRNPETGQLQYCAVGAINEAATLLGVSMKRSSMEVRTTAFDAAQNLIASKENPYLWYWNDAPDRKQQEVVDVLRLAAKRWEEENS